MESAAPSADTVLALESVSRSYGQVQAVRNVSLTLQRGEIVTLLGPSGCGKTTTLRIAIGLERSGGGRVRFRDRTVDCPAERIFVPPEKRDMGMVFQSYAIWPHLSVFENVAYPLRARRMAHDEVRRRVANALALVGLEKMSDRGSTQLSGGQQQRVAVARGLVYDPELLLMDEPFSNLDAKLREQMRTEVKLLQRRLGITILFVTHDQSEALALSDRIAVMNQGRIEQIGAPTELYAHPTTAAVRDFLGRTILLPGKLAERANGACLVHLAEGPTVRVAGHIHASAAAPGDPCVVGLRPEQIRIAPARGDESGDNILLGRIRALLFLGDRFESSIDLPSGAAASVFLSAEEAWHEGQLLRLTLPPERLLLWDPAP